MDYLFDERQEEVWEGKIAQTKTIQKRVGEKLKIRKGKETIN